ncbi:hypothetical protein AVEN_202233-1 [Araneus ventricosus]|uniref:Uncharacterized protein n=1 Tax=Araneus ventricosus TaxID=182803 RepID=A0A4Y2L384_ARAVE|nr:hypothetical protein AVEN_202233-1 [Araneus ventricosus]
MKELARLGAYELGGRQPSSSGSTYLLREGLGREAVLAIRTQPQYSSLSHDCHSVKTRVLWQILLILVTGLLAADDNLKSAGLDADRNYVESRYLRDPRDFARAFSDGNQEDIYSDNRVKKK